jgi:ADP-dependent NAD(P)H-hydrate dehydratase
VTAGLLRRWPLPQPSDEGDKEERGRVLVVGGAPELPGAVIMAATAALRAGAGKLQVATCRSIAQAVAIAVPEARVIALPETKAGAIALSAAGKIIEHARSAQAMLLGPGMIGEDAIVRLLKEVLPEVDGVPLVLDAGALVCVEHDEECLHTLKGEVVLTPHAGEMSRMLGMDKEAVARDASGTAQRAAKLLRAVVTLKGAETFISAPTGETYCNRTGNVGLATSGSGDTLSGIITGLAARGAAPVQAAVWGVHLHGRAGNRLARRVGPLGFLARELLAEVPSLMAQLSRTKKS